MRTLPRERSRNRIAAAVGAGAVAAAATLGLSTVEAGDAAATTEHRLHGCVGLSPNIIDQPFLPWRAIVAQTDRQTYIYVGYSSLWIGVGYRSDARLDWHNTTTGGRGTLTSTDHANPGFGNGNHTFAVDTAAIGRGTVNITFSAVNSNALWSIPSLPCHGAIEVR